MSAAPRALEAPYITPYSEEQVSLALGFAPYEDAPSGQRLSYLDPVDEDWLLGVLWARQEGHRRGRPLFKEVHTTRQRECMIDGLCQVCTKSAHDERDGRWWWLFPAKPSARNLLVSKPPTCRSCIPKVIESCPELRDNAYVFTSQAWELWGVVGMHVSMRGGQLRARTFEEIAFSAPDLHNVLARALIVSTWDLRPATP